MEAKKMKEENMTGDCNGGCKWSDDFGQCKNADMGKGSCPYLHITNCPFYEEKKGERKEGEKP